MVIRTIAFAASIAALHTATAAQDVGGRIQGGLYSPDRRKLF